MKKIKLGCYSFKAFLFSSIILLAWTQSSVTQALEQDKDEPKLTIESSRKTLVFTRSELLARPDVRTIEIDHDPIYRGKRTVYTAVPIRSLFEGISIPKDSTLLFKCMDGFSAPIGKTRLLNSSPKASIAYLAIEKENEKWPLSQISESPKLPGPFYVIWLNPKASEIKDDEWPFQVIGFEVKGTLAATYPAIVPSQNLDEKHPVNRGLQVFTKNCFACHTMNLQGNGNVGPDLNVPMGPTEYFQTKALKKLIRNPKSVRKWANGIMPSFSKETLSNKELDDLIQYFEYMAKRKVSQ